MHPAVRLLELSPHTRRAYYRKNAARWLSLVADLNIRPAETRNRRGADAPVSGERPNIERRDSTRPRSAEVASFRRSTGAATLGAPRLRSSAAIRQAWHSR